MYKLKREGRCYHCLLKNHLLSSCDVKINPCELCKSYHHNYLFCPTKKSSKTEEADASKNFERQTVFSYIIKTNNSPKSMRHHRKCRSAYPCVQVQGTCNKLTSRLL